LNQPEPARERILAAAQRLFMTDGYEGLDNARLAGMAGVAPSLVDRMYPDRPTLLTAVVEREASELIDRLIESIPREAPLEEMLRMAVTVFVDFVLEHRAEYELLFGAAGRLDPAIASALQGLRQRLANSYLDLFRPAVLSAGVVLPSDAEARLVTQAVLALAEGSLQAWLTDPSVPSDRFVETVAGMIYRSLVPPTGTRPASTVRLITGGGVRAVRPRSFGDSSHGKTRSQRTNVARRAARRASSEVDFERCEPPATASANATELLEVLSS
jgi:AcrR family transcriptional regulator